MEREHRLAILDTAFNYSEFAPSDLADIRAALGRCARLRVHFRELFTDPDPRRPPSRTAAPVPPPRAPPPPARRRGARRRPPGPPALPHRTRALRIARRGRAGATGRPRPCARVPAVRATGMAARNVKIGHSFIVSSMRPPRGARSRRAASSTHVSRSLHYTTATRADASARSASRQRRRTSASRVPSRTAPPPPARSDPPRSLLAIMVKLSRRALLKQCLQQFAKIPRKSFTFFDLRDENFAHYSLGSRYRSARRVAARQQTPRGRMNITPCICRSSPPGRPRTGQAPARG